MGWPCLRTELRRLAALRPSPLLASPSLDDDAADPGPPAPVHVGLEPWALHEAAELHRTFGAEIDLVVGFLGYPSRRRYAYPGPTLRPPQHYPTMDPDEISVELSVPLVVASGRHLLATVGVGNRSATALTLVTNGHLTGRVVDGRGEGVGGSPLTERMGEVTYRIDPHEAHPISVAIGTASSEPDLGYSVPPGRWGVDFLLRLADGRLVRTPPQPLTVTEATMVVDPGT